MLLYDMQLKRAGGILSTVIIYTLTRCCGCLQVDSVFRRIFRREE